MPPEQNSTPDSQQSSPNASPIPGTTTQSVGPTPIATSGAAMPENTVTPPQTPITRSTFGQPIVGTQPPNEPTQSQVVGQSSFQPQPQPVRNKKRKLTLFAGVLASVLIIGGAAAAAYMGIIVPNKPENVLQQALYNSSKEKYVHVDGNFSMKAINSSKKDAFPAMKATMAGDFDTVKNASSMKVDITVSGVNFPVEARYVNKNIYVKVGDLKTILSLLSGYASSAGLGDTAQIDALGKSIAGLISNQWVVVDSTLLEQANASCVLDSSNFRLTDQDFKLLQDIYKQNKFATIASHTSDMVNGKASMKYELQLDDDKMANYVSNKQLNNLSFMKALSKCPGVKNDVDNKADSTLADHDITPITLWVEKDTKRIVKVAGHTTAQDAKKGNIDGEFSSTISYEPVSVAAPSSAKPVMQLWGELQTKLAPLLMESNTAFDL